ncbi:MAG: ANTAR domain-containing protein, partial [candidate division NC10 bacterium]
GSRVVGEANDPEEAMRQAAMTSPDVAIVAAELGQGDGIYLAGRLATEHGIPAVLLTPTADSLAIARAVQAGMMGILVKPVDPPTLRATLEVAVCRFQEILALRREAEALRRSLEARKVIERAKGLLVEMERVSEQEAFARIRQKSMDTQRPMAEIARAIILAAEVSGRAR